jgi:hypothetical protein
VPLNSSGRRDIGPRTPTPGPILFRLRLDLIGTPQFSFGKLSGRRDLNSSAQGDIYPVAERHLRMGGGRSWGANPGPPIKAILLAVWGCSIGTSYLPTAPKAVRYRNRGLRVLLGIGGGL